jgi:lysophospholipase L1-like esterase
MTDPIKYEIQQLQNKIAELEQKRLQKELEEENAKKQTFGYYFDKLFEFIKTKNDAVNEECTRQRIYGPHSHRPEMQESNNRRVNQIVKEHNAEYVPALEHIYRALYVINKRLTKLENV